MLTYNGAFEAELRKKVQEAIDFQSEILAGGSLVDFADYKHRTGGIAALKTIFEMCDDVRTELDKR